MPPRRHHPSGLRTHDLAERTAQLHFQGWRCVIIVVRAAHWTESSDKGAAEPELICGQRLFVLLLLPDDGAVVMEVDHEKQVVYTEPLVLSPRDAPSLLAAMQPSQENTAQRLTSPIVSTHLNTRNIAFER